MESSPGTAASKPLSEIRAYVITDNKLAENAG
jgi:hypothetical protein